MPGAVIANWPIALLIIALIVCVPLWLSFRRKRVRPDYRDARAHYQAKASGSAAAQAGEYIPADRVSAGAPQTAGAHHGTLAWSCRVRPVSGPARLAHAGQLAPARLRRDCARCPRSGP